MTMLATRWSWRLFVAVLCGGWLPLPALASAFDWTVEVTPAGELFPVLDLTQLPRSNSATPGGGSGLVAVRLHGRLPAELRLRVDTAGLVAPASVEWRASPGEVRSELDLHPHLDWDTAQLRGVDNVRTQML